MNQPSAASPRYSLPPSRSCFSEPLNRQHHTHRQMAGVKNGALPILTLDTLKEDFLAVINSDKVHSLHRGYWTDSVLSARVKIPEALEHIEAWVLAEMKFRNALRLLIRPAIFEIFESRIPSLVPKVFKDHGIAEANWSPIIEIIKSNAQILDNIFIKVSTSLSHTHDKLVFEKIKKRTFNRLLVENYQKNKKSDYLKISDERAKEITNRLIKAVQEKKVDSTI